MTGPVATAYAALVAAGELKPDPAQARAVAALGRLEASLKRSKGGLLARLLNSNQDGLAGVYLWGGVGRGKSMLMDLAFDHSAVSPKRRVHSTRSCSRPIKDSRGARERGRRPIDEVAERIADEARLPRSTRCRSITGRRDDPSRLFEKLLSAGIRVVTTSNRPPVELYEDGLNRELFELHRTASGRA